MHDYYFLRMKSFLAGALVATVISAGVTYAVAANPPETIKACAHKRTGDLRIMTGKKCNRRERPVSLVAATAQALQSIQGEMGPKGETGPTGLTGPTGPTGASGISQIYSSQWENPSASSMTYTSMDTLTLPAEQYLVRSQVEFASASGSVNFVQCRLNTDVPNSIGGPQLLYRESSALTVMTMENHFNFPAGGSVIVECFVLGSFPYSAELSGSTYAIAADSISPPPSL